MAINNDEMSWRAKIITQLQERNKSETNCFYELITLRKKLIQIF